MPHFLVLDDFHHIQDVVILDVLTNLLPHQPPNFHLVLVTRGQLTEIRTADLRFSEDEAAHLLRDGPQLDLSAVDVA
jgi:LuxR family transcriptional regulator, maltose regulon positive regulatory protein